MTKEELVALATKVREGKATPEEKKYLLTEFKEKVDDLNKYLSTLEK